MKIKPIQESVLHKVQLLMRALGVLAFLYTSCGLAVQSAYADGSVSSLHMGYGAPSECAFAQFLSVIEKYNA